MAPAPFSCPVDLSLTLLSGKWKLLTLHHLLHGTRRFSELEQLLPAISPRMLVKVLRELEAYGLVLRTVYGVVPPRVEYSLTELGHSVAPLIESLRAWGQHYRAEQPQAF
ncbi:helix-turn-helix domain-containing protein [Hymenobacter sp. YC55]|uniref:winged helix-turn-helix transcriptional regulator n=1 Tax=Hymenobacter sp. YC55 TaxID=3034019 RepID=UPI0023F9344C|nr:helix-turn-helix domain-containing protein [Hymenobacter sp. YC55]MDF7815856.1 helix-turn-helix domain-containing protein [Hymenobacter sp. YC55]